MFAISRPKPWSCARVLQIDCRIGAELAYSGGGYGQQQMMAQQMMAQQAAIIQQQQLVMQQQQQQWQQQAMGVQQPQADIYGQYGSTAALPGDPALQMMTNQAAAALNPYAQMGQQGGLAGLGMPQGLHPALPPPPSISSPLQFA